jgi:hypothetical protein
MDKKAKEVPAVTKPMGDERKFSKEGKAERKHPMEHMGYKGVGKSAPGANGAEREPGMIAKKNPLREHPHKNLGYKGVGKKAPGADGKERTEGAYKKKSPFRK